MEGAEVELQASPPDSNGTANIAALPAGPIPLPVPGGGGERHIAHVTAAPARDAPDEVNLTSTDAAYAEYREMTDMREPYRIPAEYLCGTKQYVGPGVADTPLIVFINAKSGGHVGPRLLTVLFRSLGQAQVFDLAESRPGPVLRAIWDNLLAREDQGDVLAGHIRRNLRILAAGGDGTVTWILKTVRELGLEPAPAVAIMPLGTGNDLSLSFGWGSLFLDRWIAAPQLYTTLKRFADARLCHLDCWSVTITAPDSSFFPELPYALVAEPNDPRQVGGLFWNYLSVGLDAEAAYGFHTMRETHSWAASSRVLNQAWYSWYSCTSGWFCGAQPLTNKLRLRVRDEQDGPWREVTVPRNVRALVLLNIQSYGGGRDIVGLGDSTLLKGQEFKRAPIFDDGLIEVVGFGSGWHAAVTMAQVSSKVHAVRLAQCCEVELHLEARGGKESGPSTAAAGTAEAAPSPHQQQEGQQQMVVRVAHAGRSHMLFNEKDPQGGRRVRQIASRGAQLSEELPSHFSMLWPAHSK
ncbi:hypothetical protein CHLNCDRAFT_139349 [Chlorella variabilis]|uniref:Diacylglycerol kinase n=1 Tax=Chlorella variabilis TaxID=554065 RepID=E1ZQ31_CHLVA|nr:hypothetical protein CHLNCDRAFT_139349 [Chlorella variabilis]EFN52167.1 hypothetical protein CHLNCDRAFT_139349 [Chlorella variabilis]|eukprot:XP_005844269.1 hypothetical protein CHLNCDRAFT_139349 [Chlorella variabilis]